MVQTIKLIMFDCFGVLATDSWEAFIDSLPAEADVAQAREARRAYDAGLIDKYKYGQLIKLATGRQFIGVESGLAKVAKNYKLLDYIRDLRQRHYRTSILSNAGSNWIREEFLDSSEQALFDDFVLSYKVGMVKPEERLFTLAAERLQVEPAEVILVDDKERYCQAAKDVGMQAVVYRDFEQFKRELEELLAGK
jgi:putative hydrolase of the HAD superfamily